MSTSKAVWLAITVSLVVLFAVSILIPVKAAIDISTSISQPYQRAQVAGNPEKMEGYLHKTLRALDEHEMKNGYTSIWVKGPWTNMREIRGNIDRVLNRLETIKKLPSNSNAYQQGMDDCRGILRENKIQAFGYWTVNQWGWIWLYFFLPFSIIGSIVSGFMFLAED